jgi:hypothetical protein
MNPLTQVLKQALYRARTKVLSTRVTPPPPPDPVRTAIDALVGDGENEMPWSEFEGHFDKVWRELLENVDDEDETGVVHELLRAYEPEGWVDAPRDDGEVGERRSKRRRKEAVTELTGVYSLEPIAPTSLAALTATFVYAPVEVVVGVPDAFWEAWDKLHTFAHKLYRYDVASPVNDLLIETLHATLTVNSYITFNDITANGFGLNLVPSADTEKAKNRPPSLVWRDYIGLRKTIIALYYELQSNLLQNNNGHNAFIAEMSNIYTSILSFKIRSGMAGYLSPYDVFETKQFTSPNERILLEKFEVETTAKAEPPPPLFVLAYAQAATLADGTKTEFDLPKLAPAIDELCKRYQIDPIIVAMEIQKKFRDASQSLSIDENSLADLMEERRDLWYREFKQTPFTLRGKRVLLTPRQISNLLAATNPFQGHVEFDGVTEVYYTSVHHTIGSVSLEQGYVVDHVILDEFLPNCEDGFDVEAMIVHGLPHAMHEHFGPVYHNFSDTELMQWWDPLTIVNDMLNKQNLFKFFCRVVRTPVLESKLNALVEKLKQFDAPKVRQLMESNTQIDAFYGEHMERQDRFWRDTRDPSKIFKDVLRGLSSPQTSGRAMNTF